MPNYRTMRRRFLDAMLFDFFSDFTGRVLDVGGEKFGSRGQFRPPSRGDLSWTYLNSSSESRPDLLMDADLSGLSAETFDCVVLTEVLEHLEKPESALKGAHRVLVPGGSLVISMPFLVGIHGDPDDFQRWTPSKLRFSLQDMQFSVLDISPMGGLPSVALDLAWHSLLEKYRSRRSFSRRILIPVLSAAMSLGGRLIAISESPRSITTGWLVVATKALQ